MKTQWVRQLIVAIWIGMVTAGASISNAADPQSGSASDLQSGARDVYHAPAKWNQFRRPTTSAAALPDTGNRLAFGATIQSVAAQDPIESLPIPSAALIEPLASEPAVVPPHQHDHAAAATPGGHRAGDSVSPYANAAAAPWDGETCGNCAASCGDGSCGPARRSGPFPISPWFGGANLVFWNLAGELDTPLINYDNGVTVSRYSDLDPEDSVGYDIHFGRYLGCGQYGLDFGYMNWDPAAYSRIFTLGGAGLVLINPALNAVSINRGAGATTVYDDFDINAAGIRVTRDVRMQGFEANVNCFGLMGARRLGSCSPGPLCGGALSNFGNFGSGYYGGATGPLARAACGRLRVQSLHGFRWFQFEDELEIAGNVDGVGGYQPSDLHYISETENNLYGYQFGSRLSYCLGARALINIGGKIGIYANDAQFSHRITTDTVMAYTNSQGAGAGDVCTDDSDVSLAGLGELDMGLGYRLSNRWTVNGGYRFLAVSGVATAIGQMPTEYTSAASAGAVRADDSLILHGAYVGLDYNW